MAKFAKAHPGTMPHLRWNSFQQMLTAEIYKGLQLVGYDQLPFEICRTFILPNTLDAKF